MEAPSLSLPLAKAFDMPPGRETGAGSIGLPTTAPCSQLALLPGDWLLWLDHIALLHVKSAGISIDAEAEEQLWRGLCAAELNLPVASLVIAGPVPEVPAAVAQDRQPRVCRWRRVFYDLDTSTTRNDLRHTGAAYKFFPSSRGEDAERPRDLEFAADAAGRMVHCRLTGHFGGDRCIVATHPLPSVLSATALPRLRTGACGKKVCEWEVSYRPGGYYEVTLNPPPPGSGQRRVPQHFTPCISVGLCTARLTRSSIAYKQAGWDAESWALHGDDGHLFNGSSRGETFIWISPEAARRRGGDLLWRRWRTGMPRLRFGEGDTIGCGLVHMIPDGAAGQEADEGSDSDSPRDGLGRPGEPAGAALLRETPRGIYYTLNGEFIGMPWLLQADQVPSDVPLWPCVGIDAPWQVSFNFGQEPFRFDVDSAFPPSQVWMGSPFTTLETWPRSSTCSSSAAPCPMRPLVSKFAHGPLLGSWAARPAQQALKRFRSERRNLWFSAPEEDGPASDYDSDSESSTGTTERSSPSGGHQRSSSRRRTGSRSGSRPLRWRDDGPGGENVPPPWLVDDDGDSDGAELVAGTLEPLEPPPVFVVDDDPDPEAHTSLGRRLQRLREFLQAMHRHTEPLMAEANPLPTTAGEAEPPAPAPEAAAEQPGAGGLQAVELAEDAGPPASGE